MTKFKHTALALALALSSITASALEFTVHAAPGGPSDTVTRILAQRLSPQLPIVNRPGAGARIAVKRLLEGKSVMLATVTQVYVTNTVLHKSLEYKPQEDLMMIATVAVMPNILVCRSGLMIGSINDLAQRDNLAWAHAGLGSSEHLATELLLSKLKGRHRVVPYSRGGSAAINDLLGGTIDCMFANAPTVKAWLNDSRITALLSTHEMGIAPTWRQVFKEEFLFQSYLSLVVASSMPQLERDQLIDQFAQMFKQKELINELTNAGVIAQLSTDRAAIDRVLRNNQTIKEFIERRAINLQD